MAERINYYVAEGWRDNVVMLNLGQSGGVKEPDFVDFVGTMKQWAFDSATMEEMYVNFHIDHDYAPGTAVFTHIHWAPSDATTGVVRWGLEMSIAKGHSQEPFSAVTTYYMEQEAGGIDRLHNVAEVATGILGGGVIEPDTMLMCRIFRDAAHANDTYSADAFGLCVDLHYQVDRNSTPQKSPDFYTTPYVPIV